jgi:hypothetical protein
MAPCPLAGNINAAEKDVRRIAIGPAAALEEEDG